MRKEHEIKLQILQEASELPENKGLGYLNDQLANQIALELIYDDLVLGSESEHGFACITGIREAGLEYLENSNRPNSETDDVIAEKESPKKTEGKTKRLIGIATKVGGVILFLCAVLGFYFTYMHHSDKLIASITHFNINRSMGISLRNTGNQNETITHIALMLTSPVDAPLRTEGPKVLGNGTMVVPPGVMYIYKLKNGSSCYEIPLFSEDLWSIKGGENSDRTFPLPEEKFNGVCEQFERGVVFKLGLRFESLDSNGNSYNEQITFGTLTQEPAGWGINFYEHLPINIDLLAFVSTNGPRNFKSLTINTNPVVIPIPDKGADVDIK